MYCIVNLSIVLRPKPPHIYPCILYSTRRLLVIKKKKKELFEFKLKILFYIVIALVYLKYLINVQTL